jgi:hypothetical protein
MSTEQHRSQSEPEGADALATPFSLESVTLPLQKIPRESGCSVFLDEALRPYPDQWPFLAPMQPSVYR